MLVDRVCRLLLVTKIYRLAINKSSHNYYITTPSVPLVELMLYSVYMIIMYNRLLLENNLLAHEMSKRPRRLIGISTIKAYFSLLKFVDLHNKRTNIFLVLKHL